MITYLVCRTMLKNPDLETENLWYGFGFSLLFDVFLLGLLIAWLRITFHF